MPWLYGALIFSLLYDNYLTEYLVNTPRSRLVSRFRYRTHAVSARAFIAFLVIRSPVKNCGWGFGIPTGEQRTGRNWKEVEGLRQSKSLIKDKAFA